MLPHLEIHRRCALRTAWGDDRALSLRRFARIDITESWLIVLGDRK
jgi:hypothetical protein